MSVKPSGQGQANLRGSPEQQPAAVAAAVPAELESVTRRLDRLKTEILPSSPYLLTVPSDVPFRLGNRLVNNWAVGKKGPFAIDEQQLQYMTFLMHHDADSLLVAVGDWSDNDGRVMGKMDEEKPRAPPSASETPQAGVAKKKITLSDYKTRAKGEPPAREPPQKESRKEKHTSLQAPSTHSMNERSSHGRLPDSSLVTSSHSKRPLKESLKDAHTPPAPKRARLTPPRSENGSFRTQRENHTQHGKNTHHDKHVQQQQQQQKRDANGIPALLSPTLPPTSSSPHLPELLSPTLPPELEEELAQIEDDTYTLPNQDVKRETIIGTKAPRYEPPKIKPPASNRVRPESNSATHAINPKEESKTSSLTASGKTDIRRSMSPYEQRSPFSVTTKPAVATGTAKKLIVKLRYGRANRKRVGALLRFDGKRKMSDSLPSRGSKESLSGGEDMESLRSDTKIRDSKRERSSDNDVLEERQRRPFGAGKTIPSDTTKLSNTKAFKSPSHKRLPASKTEIPTPAKDSRAKHQRLTDGGDAEVKTPSGTSGKTLAAITDKAIKTTPSNGDSQLSLREKERRAWRDEFHKHTGLGRELKHIADRYARSKAMSTHDSTADGKLAAVSAVEAILCFIIAFIVDDRCKSLARQIGDSETWRSIIPYWRVVERNTADYPHLHGLCLVLGAVSHDAINSLDLERLAVCTVPGEQSPVPTPGSDGNTVNSDKTKPQKREFFELRSRLPENHKEANRLWLEGCRELPDDVLIREFPETWAKRSRNFAERGQDNFKIGHYSGNFFLPFGRTTTPMEAVRFGMTLLREWCKKEDIDFQARLKL